MLSKKSVSFNSAVNTAANAQYSRSKSLSSRVSRGTGHVQSTRSQIGDAPAWAIQVHVPASRTTNTTSHVNSSNPPINQKSFDFPQYNSSKSHEKLIEQAIQDISKLPEKIERVVAEKMTNIKFRSVAFSKATKKTNFHKSETTYHDLLEIDSVAPISIKRITQETKTVDVAPNLCDYIRPEFVRVKPSKSFPGLPFSAEEFTTTSIDIDEHFNPNDLENQYMVKMK